MSDKAHQGEIIKKAVIDSGIKISVLASKIGKSRRLIYIIFNKEEVDLRYMKKIGEAINHNFFIKNNPNHAETSHSYQKVNYWKDAYIKLLEEHNELLKLHYGKN
jgi:ribosome-binding protein aMBF1 (putative translation factor)